MNTVQYSTYFSLNRPEKLYFAQENVHFYLPEKIGTASAGNDVFCRGIVYY